ncbi:unnamed protein product [Sphagnum balticum]
MDNAELFSYGGHHGETMWMPPGAMMPAPLGTMWQLVPIDTTTPNMKSKEKSEKEKQEGGGQQEKKQTPAAKQDKQGKQQPKYELKVNMCCAKCAEKVKEEIFEVAGVMDVQTDVATSKVTVFGKVPDPLLVLKKARKVNKKAEFISDPLAGGEQKKSELNNMAVKSDQKKSLHHHHHHNKSNNKSADQDSHLLLPTVGSEAFVDPSNSSSLSSTTYRNYYTTKPAMVAAAPPPYSSYHGMMPYYYAPHLYHQHHSSSTAAAAYRPSQSYPPNHYPQYLETDYSNYYPNPNYLTHIKSSY